MVISGYVITRDLLYLRCLSHQDKTRLGKDMIRELDQIFDNPRILSLKMVKVESEEIPALASRRLKEIPKMTSQEAMNKM